jgi:predicted DNA-binding transcriptional regulator AlpA
MENNDVPAPAMTRQQICAALGVSESTIRRLEHAGLPYTAVGARSKRYDLAECKAWLRTQYVAPTRDTAAVGAAADLQRRGEDLIESSKKMKLRVRPS